MVVKVSSSASADFDIIRMNLNSEIKTWPSIHGYLGEIRSGIHKWSEWDSYSDSYSDRPDLLRRRLQDHLTHNGFSRLFQVWGDRGLTIQEIHRGLAAKHKFKQSISGMLGAQTNNKTLKKENGRWKIIKDAPYLYKNYQHHSDFRSEIRTEMPPEGIQRIKEIAQANRRRLTEFLIKMI